MFALRMPPAAVFSHSTAALLMGAPLPLREELTPELRIALPAPHRAPHARGIRGHRLSLVPHEVRERDGLRQTTPARTWCDLATRLPPSRINHEIVMTDGGTDVRTDLHYDAANVHVEYQGDYHRSRHQWRKDMTRRTRLEARGGHVLEINADDLRDPGELVDRVRMLLHRRSGSAQ